MSHRDGVAVAALLLTGCAALLGGLEDGTARDVRDATPDREGDAAPVALEAGTDCGAWLDGFARRLTVDVENGDAAAPAFALRLALDTRRLIEHAELQRDGADLRVTAGDGTTVLPHWIEGRIGGEATALWARIDLAPGANRLFVYHGSGDAGPASRAEEVFTAGVVANPRFDGTAPWIAAPPRAEGGHALVLQDRRAVVGLSRAASDAGDALGWCQSIAFPAGARHRLVFDVTVLEVENAELVVSTGGVDGAVVWRGPFVSGPQRGVSSDPIESGRTMVCLGGRIAALGGALSGYFEDVRVRPAVDPEPIAGPAHGGTSCSP